MNFTTNVNSRSKGKTVWKRNANTSQTNRKPAKFYSIKTRLTSESSDYSCFPDTEHNLKLNTTTISKPQNKPGQWNEVKTMAKHTTIASRMELKKTLPISMLSASKYDTINKSRVKSSNSRSKSFSRVIDTNGNITTSFKQSSEFKSINPHIPKDVDKLRMKTFNLYKKQKKTMDEFLGEEESDKVTMATFNDDRINSRAKSLLIDYDRNSEMQKISERQEYESRMNSTRIKGNQSGIEGKDKVDGDVKEEIERKKKEQEIRKQANKYVEEETVKMFTKSKNKSVYEHKAALKTKSTTGLSTVSPDKQNILLKGLLGEYSNYEKLSKHDLIQKLISLEYLAQNIFKKNKFLEEQLQKKQALFKSKEKWVEDHLGSRGNQFKNNFTQNSFKNSENSLPDKTKIHSQSQNRYHQSENRYHKSTLSGNKVLESSGSNRNLFVIDNEDGYFNEFLESQKGKDKQHFVEVSIESPERFREDQ